LSGTKRAVDAGQLGHTAQPKPHGLSKQGESFATKQRGLDPVFGKKPHAQDRKGLFSSKLTTPFWLVRLGHGRHMIVIHKFRELYAETNLHIGSSAGL
jgi:hypothetical protein